MPQNNCFRHQDYPTKPSTPPKFQKVRIDGAKGFDFSRLHTESGVHRVILVHGTFLGDDPLALVDMMAAFGRRVSFLEKPLASLRAGLKEKTPQLTRWATGDVANYTPEFRDALQKLVGGDPAIELPETGWSGQNDHVARADLAVRLLCRIHELQPTRTARVLLWGHSHAGNGFALLSNLLGNDRASVRRFFEAAGPRTEDHWVRARQILDVAETPHPLAESVLMATFGTPVRYGWETNGLAGLVHISHHRNYDPADPARTHPIYPFHKLSEIVGARYGDWVQAFAVAGTDVSAPTAATTNKKLAGLLEQNLLRAPPKKLVPQRVLDAQRRWKTGTRCHADGRNLLIEYEPGGRLNKLRQPIEHSVFGHGVATTLDWLPVHLKLVIEGLSGPQAGSTGPG